MPWQVYQDTHKTEYKNDGATLSIWRAFVFEQNQVSVVTTAHAATLIIAFMKRHNIELNAQKINNETELSTTKDKKLFCGKLLEFAELYKHDAAFELNAKVIQELKLSSVSIEYLENFEARLRALELGVQYQNVPKAREFKAPLQFMFIPRPPVTKYSVVAAGVNTYDTYGFTPIQQEVRQIHFSRNGLNAEMERTFLDKIASLIQQGANLELQLFGSQDNGYKVLEYIERCIGENEKSNTTLLKVTQLLLEAGADPNYLKFKYYSNGNFFTYGVLSESKNNIFRQGHAAFIALLLHYGAPTLTSARDLGGIRGSLEQARLNSMVLNAYNGMRGQAFFESSAAASTNGAALSGIASALPIASYTAITDPADIGIENRALRRKIDNALQIQAVYRGHLSRTTKEGRTALIEARRISLTP